MKILALLFTTSVFAVPVQNSNISLNEYFAGCRATAAECVMSCPKRAARWELNRKLCNPADYRERLACFCLVKKGEKKR